MRSDHRISDSAGGLVFDAPQRRVKPMAPIENPSSPIMRLVSTMTRRQFGKVLTPLKVFAARLPSAFGNFYGKVNALDK